MRSSRWCREVVWKSLLIAFADQGWKFSAIGGWKLGASIPHSLRSRPSFLGPNEFPDAQRVGPRALFLERRGDNAIHTIGGRRENKMRVEILGTDIVILVQKVAVRVVELQISIEVGAINVDDVRLASFQFHLMRQPAVFVGEGSLERRLDEVATDLLEELINVSPHLPPGDLLGYADAAGSRLIWLHAGIA